MEILVTLSHKELLYKLNNTGIDGVIFGGLFSTKFNYNLEEVGAINDFCLVNKLKRYISIDAFIEEKDLETLEDYLNYIMRLNVDGIYFSDLAVLAYGEQYKLKEKLIYDPCTLTTNSNDISFYINRNIGVCLARELTLQEIAEIISYYPSQLDMQIFGHLRMSYSKRKFLSNYFKEINKNINIVNDPSLTLVEESRNYRLPIKETKYGTTIYTDYVFLMHEEYIYLYKLIKRGIIDSEFINDDVLLDFLRDLKKITKDNAEYITSAYKQKHFDIDFSKGYLYQKTVNKKEENE